METVMTDALTIGWTRAQAARRRTTYRRLLALNLILQTALGLVALVAPVWLARAADLPGPPPAGWVQLWGVMLLIMVLLYVPGYVQPVYVRWPNIMGIVARFALAVVYVCLDKGFRWFALYEALFAVALTWSYSRLLRDELMAEP
jgi:hypothetical protein